VFHVAERHAGLLPDDPKARARAIAWMFAALNTVEPLIVARKAAACLERDKTWHEERLPILDASACGSGNFPVGSATPTGSTMLSAPATC